MNDTALLKAWAAQGAAFAVTAAPQRARAPLAVLTAGIIFELIVSAIALVALGAFMYNNIAAPQFVFPAAALDLYAIFIVQGLIRQLIAIHAVQYWEPVTIVQRRFETVRRTRLLFTQITVALMALAWTPLLIVALKAFFGVDAYATLGTAYIVANVLFGLAALAGFIAIAKRYGAQLSQIPALAGLANALEGCDLARTSELLKTIAEFADEG